MSDSTELRNDPSAQRAAGESPGGDDEYVVVARRYRPQSFDELIGQEHVAKSLEAAISAGRVGHAYLFTGARGVGKTSAARILAKALNCASGPAPVSCNQCDICQSISAGTDVDVLEIDGASNRGIDEIRQLRSNVNIRPSRARLKIYIIDEVHMLTREAFNALLKTLEEPPEHVKFIFCTTEPNKIPITVLSRCQRYDFAGIELAAIAQRLAQIVAAEGMTAEPEALALVARRAAGSMRDSQSLLEQLLAFAEAHITVAEVNELLGIADSTRLLALARSVAGGDTAEALQQLNAVLAEGVDVGLLLEQLLGVFRDYMVVQAGCSGDALQTAVTPDEQTQLSDAAARIGLPTTMGILDVLQHALASMRYTTYRRTMAEVALVRACSLEGLDALADLVAELREGDAADRTPASRGGQPAKKKPDATGSIAPEVPAADKATRAEPQARRSNSDDAKERDAPPARTVVTEQNARKIWEEALERVSGVVSVKAGQYQGLKSPAPNRLVVEFNEAYNLCKSYCERPEPLAKIQKALAEVTGARVEVVFSLTLDGPPPAATTALPKKTVSRQQKLTEVRKHPLVQQAGDLFGARPVDVDDRT